MAASASWWNGLDGDTKAALIGAGATAAGGYFQNRAEDARHDEDQAASAITNRAEGIGAIQAAEKSDFEFNANRNDSNATNAAKMSGSSPLEFQAQRAKMSALGEILSGKAGQANFGQMPGNISKHMPKMSTTPFSSGTMAFFSPEAMANSEQNYWSAQNNIDPRLTAPDLGKVGYGPAGSTVSSNLGTEQAGRLDTRSAEQKAYEDSAKSRREALMAALNELGPEGTGANAADDGGIDWKKWGTLAAAGGAGYLGAKYA